MLCVRIARTATYMYMYIVPCNVLWTMAVAVQSDADVSVGFAWGRSFPLIVN